MRLLKGLAALVVSAVLLVGIPAALVFFAGNPIPSWEGLVEALTRPDYNGAFLVGTVLPLVGWVAWATFAVGFVLEIPNQLPARAGSRRARRKVRVAGLGVQQKAAGVLIGAIIAIGAPAGAFAAETPVQDASVSQASVQQQTQTFPAEAPAEPVVEERTVFHDRTVQAGDTLWDIAKAELGAGERFGEIVEATRGVVQPDGQQLTDPDLIQPGWTVKVPSIERVVVESPAAPVEEPESGEEIADPFADAPATDAGTAGGAAGAAEAGASGETDTGTTGAGRLVGDTQTGKPADASFATDAGQAAEEAEDGAGFDLFSPATLGGIGGVLAAGLLGLLGWRRVMQRRDRKPGQKIALPETVSPLELEMRSVEDPGGQEHLDTVLRHLAVWAQEQPGQVVLPTMIRIDQTEVTLYFTDGAADLPTGLFTKASDDGLVWSMPRHEIPELVDVPSAPMPALVALGRDENDGTIYVDLEQIGALNIISDQDELRVGSLTALTIELAVNAWSEDVRVLVVGDTADLPASLGTGRIEKVADVDTLLRNLRVQADAAGQVLAEMGVDSPEQARLAHADADGWAPEIIVLAEQPEQAVQEELGELVSRIPRVGIAAISNGYLAGDWNFTLDSAQEAALTIPAWDVSIPVIPQLVTRDEAAQLAEVFDIATNGTPTGDATGSEIDLDQIGITTVPASPALVPVDTQGEQPGQDSEDTLDETAATDDTAAAPAEEAAETEPAIADHLEEETHEDTESGEDAPQAAVPSEHSADTHDETADTGPAATTAQEEDTPAPATTDDATDDSVEVVEAPAPVAKIHTAPYLKLLGDVDLTGARGSLPMDGKNAKVSRNAMKYGTELVAYLSVTPDASAKQVSEAMWPGQLAEGKQANSRRNGLVSKLRRWLGENDDGELYVPRKMDAYRLHDDVRTDWQDFCELVGDDIHTASTDTLTAALDLVSGQPLSGVDDKRYVWADLLRQEMITRVGDVAHEVATRALETGDVRLARRAATLARTVDPIQEAYWRDALRAEYAAGDEAGFERIVTHLEQHLASIDPDYEPAAETQQLITDIRGRRRDAA